MASQNVSHSLPSILDPQSQALRLLADAWELLRRSPFIEHQVEGRLSRLPDFGPTATAAAATTARELLARIDALDLDALPPALSVPLRQARYGAQARAKAGDWYWTVIDPAGVGFYGQFLPSAYCGGWILKMVYESIERPALAHPGDLDRQLALLADLPRLIGQMTERTRGQAERGMRMPRPQIPSARSLVAAFAARSNGLAQIADERFSDATRPLAAAFRAEAQRRIDTQLRPAFATLAAVFDAAYEAAAPEAVGMSQFEGGAEIYRELVRLHTTLDLSPEAVHAAGHARLQTIDAELRAIRAEVGLADDPQAYLARLQADPRYRAADADGVAAVFRRYIDRMDAVFAQAFHHGAHARHGVAPLPDALQGSMTFGYYDAPKPGQDEGRFLFNASHLTKNSLFHIGALTYHELVPGHHLHASTQRENECLHPLGRYAFCNAYNEGWAEYAATLAGELGCYQTAEERYGRFAMDAFLTCRLVVDTGMNALGWPLEQAREFLRAHSTMSEAEIRSETLRYSCDVPAQALAYKLGDSELLALRDELRQARQARGEALDLRDFHAAVLAHGAMPLPDLRREVSRLLS